MGDKTQGEQAIVAGAKVSKKRLSDYKANPRNHNAGSERGSEMIERSFREYGAGRSLVADKDGVLIAGNHAQEGALSAGLTDVIEVETDGNTVVVVKRRDLDLDQDMKAVELGYMDNRSNQVSLTFDAQQIAADIERGVDLSSMFTPSELAALTNIEVMPELDATPQPIAETFGIFIDCDSEEEQKALLERLEKEGVKCRALIS